MKETMQKNNINRGAVVSSKLVVGISKRRGAVARYVVAVEAITLCDQKAVARIRRSV